MAIRGNQFLLPQEVITLTNLREGDKVADLGAGSGGFFTIPFAQTVGVTGKVYAVDILPEAIRTIETAARTQNLTNIETIRSDLEVTGATKIPKGSLDVAFLINMLFQNKDKKTVLQEADSFVKKDGLIVVIDWAQSGNGFGPSADMLVNRDLIEQLLEGYEQIAAGDLGNYHFMDVYRKI